MLDQLFIRSNDPAAPESPELSRARGRRGDAHSRVPMFPKLGAVFVARCWDKLLSIFEIPLLYKWIFLIYLLRLCRNRETVNAFVEEVSLSNPFWCFHTADGWISLFFHLIQIICYAAAAAAAAGEAHETHDFQQNSCFPWRYSANIES